MRIVFSQTPFGYLHSYRLGQIYNEAPREGVVGNPALSDSYIDAMELVGATHVDRVPSASDLEIFYYQHEEQRKICYLLRKRCFAAGLIDQAARALEHIGDYELVFIDGTNPRLVAQQIFESCFFISLMRTESLGLPAIEAMASGCIVIDYTGFAATEFLDSEFRGTCQRGQYCWARKSGGACGSRLRRKP